LFLGEKLGTKMNLSSHLSTPDYIKKRFVDLVISSYYRHSSSSRFIPPFL
jgi:hypothetical protein